MPAPEPRTGHRSRHASTILLGLGGLLHLATKLPIVRHDQGIYWPDEIYESLEMAHRLVFGYGLVPWEFVEGARSWAFPFLLTVPMQLTAAFGMTSPDAYLLGTRLLFVASTLLVGWQVARSAERLEATPLVAAAAGTAFLLCAMTLFFSHRALSENAAQLPALAGVVRLLRPARTRRDVVVGASWLGVATLLRLQLGVLCLVVLILDAGLAFQDRRRRADLPLLVATLAGWAVVYGALDAATWGTLDGARGGGWFHSAIVYLRFNLVEGRAALWGTAPWTYYGVTLLRTLEGLGLLLAAGLVLAARRQPRLVIAIVVFIGLHSAVPHKELRFILPVLPLLFVAAAVGLSALPRPAWRRLALVTLLAATAASWLGHRQLTMWDIGAYPARGAAPAFDDFGAINRLLLVLHREPDTCGVRIDAPLSWTGGLTYLHRQVPMYGDGMHPPPTPTGGPHVVTHVIAGAAAPTDGHTIARDGGFRLVRIATGRCAGDPGYDWTLR